MDAQTLLSLASILNGIGLMMIAAAVWSQKQHIDNAERWLNRLADRVARADVMIGHTREHHARLHNKVTALTERVERPDQAANIVQVSCFDTQEIQPNTEAA